MLRVTIDTGNKKIVRDLLVIDAHSHVGKDVDGAEVMSPMAAKGTFDFWVTIENRIQADWQQGKGSPVFNAKYQGQNAKYTLEFVQHPVITNLFKALESRNKSGAYTNFYERFKNQHLIDQAVCFPFQDVYRDKMPEALYRASNTNIFRHVTKFPVSMRMIGYMRCHPLEGEKALAEIDYWAKTGGIRGLKLHPRSEAWLESITSPQAIQVITRAAQYNMPVIFDTRGKKTILDIAELIRNSRQTLQTHAPHLVKNLKVIIAHFAQGNVDDEEIYRTITQPNTWGDLSMLHGMGTSKFLQSFRKWCEVNRIQEKTGRIWSEFLLFATDYPYFGDVHAKELIVYLFNQEFFESGGTLEDSANILGLNQLRLLPEYGQPYNLPYNSTAVSTFLQNTQSLPQNFQKKPSSPLTSKGLMYKTIAALIDDGIIDIQKFLLQFKGDWNHFQEEFCLITNAKNNQEKIVPLLYMNLFKDDIGLLATLPKGFQWKQLGYKYFDPEVRAQFHHIFQNSFPAAIETDAVQMLNKAYQ